MGTCEAHNIIMETQEFNAQERRRLDETVKELTHACAAQTNNITKLLVVSENNTTAVSKMEQWIASHEADYRIVRERLLQMEVTGTQIDKRIEMLTTAIESTMKSYLADKSRVTGGWQVLVSIGAIIMAAISIFAVFYNHTH